jgi:hypothetical protein
MSEAHERDGGANDPRMGRMAVHLRDGCNRRGTIVNIWRDVDGSELIEARNLETGTGCHDDADQFEIL